MSVSIFKLSNSRIKPTITLWCGRYLSATASDSTIDSHGVKGQRFNAKHMSFVTTKCSSAIDALDKISTAIRKSELSLPFHDYGLIVVPKFELLIPVKSGVLQTQHVVIGNSNLVRPTLIEDSSGELESIAMTVCGFHERDIHEDREEREVHPERLMALNKVLKSIANVTAEELMSPSYTGSSARRIYRAYVMPRVNKSHRIEPEDISALRVAHQIDLALRQMRADQAASYLRNTDKSVPVEKLSASKTLNPIILVLDNVRASNNVGSLFRTAETVGVTELITCGITPHPPHPKLNKTALGSTDIVPTRHELNSLHAVQALKAQGYTIVAMETCTTAVKYSKVQYPKKVAIVVGNEVTGVDPLILEIADVIAEIPMFGVKNSLNVSAAAPVVLFEILRQWEDQ